MKPKFLDNPPRYTRTQRTSQSDVDQACAIERAEKRPMDWQDRVVITACIIAVLATIVILGVTS